MLNEPDIRTVGRFEWSSRHDRPIDVATAAYGELVSMVIVYVTGEATVVLVGGERVQCTAKGVLRGEPRGVRQQLAATVARFRGLLFRQGQQMARRGFRF